MKYVFYVLATVVIAIFTVDFYLTQIQLPQQTTLHSSLTQSEPLIDGNMDEVWKKAVPITIPLEDGANIVALEVQVRSLHTKDYVFFLSEWADDKASLELQPWELKNGKWQQKMTSRYDENVFAEDKFSFIWPIKGSVFANNGCASTCHSPALGKDYGAKYAPGNELLDLWRWGSVTTNPQGIMDDMFVDREQASPENFYGGIKYDPFFNKATKNRVPPDITANEWFQISGRKKNINEAKDQPLYFSKEFFLYNTKNNTNNNMKNTMPTELSSIVHNKDFKGTIQAKGKFSDGKWILEIKRKRITNDPADLQMRPQSHNYLFSVAVFNDSLLRHSYTEMVYRLTFDSQK